MIIQAKYLALRMLKVYWLHHELKIDGYRVQQ